MTISTIRTAATVVATLYGVTKSLHPFTAQAIEWMKPYDQYGLSQQAEAMREVVVLTLERFHWTRTVWQYAGWAAIGVRGVFTIKSCWNWWTDSRIERRKRWVVSATRMLKRAKEYHILFQEMAKTKRDLVDQETYNKIVDINNQFSNIAHKKYVDDTLKELLRLSWKTIVKIEGGGVESRPTKKQRIK